MIEPEVVAANLGRIRERIAAAGGDPAAITVVAATKGFGPDAVEAALAAGIRDVGESRAQELVPKAEALGELGDGPRWHFMATVQRNKVAALAPYVHLWQAVDRLVVGQAIAARAPGAAVLVEVDLSGAAGRGGVAPGLVPGLVAGLRDLDLDVRGLMCIGPLGPPEAARPGFREVAGLRERLGLQVLSMGMTEDLEVAVQEGSTMVRIGRALFGPRPGAPDLRR